MPEDRQTWFRVLPDKGEEYIRQEAYENYIECETVTITETFQGTEDSAKGIFLHEGGTSEDPDVGNSKYPVKGNSDAPRRGKSEDTGEVTPEDVKEANSQESGTGSLKIRGRRATSTGTKGHPFKNSWKDCMSSIKSLSVQRFYSYFIKFYLSLLARERNICIGR